MKRFFVLILSFGCVSPVFAMMNQNYMLSISYKYEDGTQASSTVFNEYLPGTKYSIPSPSIEGFSPSIPVVSGTLTKQYHQVDVVYSRNSYKLTVNYKYPDGSPAADSVTLSVKYEADYSVESPEVKGGIPDLPVVSGFMPANDVVLDVTYSPETYFLTINYKFSDGSTVSEPVTHSFKFGEEYSIPSPEIDGYTADKSVVSGVMPSYDLEVDVVYSTIPAHTLTVEYRYENGDAAADSVVQPFAAGAEYSILSPTIEGFLPDIAVVSGTMPDDDLKVVVTYSGNVYTLTVNYIFEDGSAAAGPEFRSLSYGAQYSVESPKVDGYIASIPIVSGTMPNEDLTVDVVYTVSAADLYLLKVHFQYADGSPAADSYEQSFPEGSPYSVQPPEIAGFAPDLPVVSGVMPGEDVEITVVYSPIPVSPDAPAGGETGGGAPGNSEEMVSLFTQNLLLNFGEALPLGITLLAVFASVRAVTGIMSRFSRLL